MAWYNSAIHAIGNVVGPAAEGVGTAYDYVTPGKGSSRLTNAGHAITNPNVTYNPSVARQINGKNGSGSFVSNQAITNYTPPSSGTHQDKGTGQGNTTNPTEAELAAQQAAAAKAAQEAKNQKYYNIYGNRARCKLTQAEHNYGANVDAINSQWQHTLGGMQHGYDKAEQNYNNSVDEQNQDRLHQNIGGSEAGHAWMAKFTG